MAKRSEPGLGQKVAIYLLARADDWRGDCVLGNGDGFTTMMAGPGEDYAECAWPVVVKAKPHVTSEDLARHLRNLADAVETGCYQPADADKPRSVAEEAIPY